jgi:hypothetical protein
VSKLLRVLALVLALAAPAAGQVSGPPHVFVAGTVASPDEVNLNFSTIYDAACNRGGCTMTGAFSGVNGTFSGTLGVTGNTTLGGTLGVTGASTLAALSATTGSFSSTLAVTGAATLTSTLAVNSTSAAAIDVAGGITAGSGNVGIVDTTGKIPAISSTFFASLSGANLTSIPEAAITDGAILARVAANETISGTYSFTTSSDTEWTAGSILFANGQGISLRNAASSIVDVLFIDSNSDLLVGTSAATLVDTHISAGPTGGITFTAGGSQRTVIDNTGALIHAGAIAFTNTISPSALSNGNNNNYNPTGWANAFLVRLDGGAGSPSLTGFAAPSSGGILKVLCRVAGNGISVPNEDANSTAANRTLASGGSLTLNAVADGDCALIVYDSVSARWRNISVTQ